MQLPLTLYLLPAREAHREQASKGERERGAETAAVAAKWSCVLGAGLRFNEVVSLVWNDYKWSATK